MAVSKPVELRCDDVILVRWLTSNPQHFNPRNAIAMRCQANGSPATPWPKVPEGADVGFAKIKFAHRPPHQRAGGRWPSSACPSICSQ